jgi:hypothetical protein
MEDKEVEAILAHELGHFHHQHIRKQIIISFLTSLIGLYLTHFSACPKPGCGCSTSYAYVHPFCVR